MRTALNLTLVLLSLLPAGTVRATEKVAKYRNIQDTGLGILAINTPSTFTTFVNATPPGGTIGTFFEVYTAEEINQRLKKLEASVGQTLDDHLKNLTDASATKKELANLKTELTVAVGKAVEQALGPDEEARLRATIKSEIKSDPDFRREFRQEIAKELIDDPTFLSDVAAKLKSLPPTALSRK